MTCPLKLYTICHFRTPYLCVSLHNLQVMCPCGTSRLTI